MKNLKYILILIAFLLLNIESFGQLPLQYGDGIITHSPNSYSASGSFSTNGPVVRVIHTSNTSTAPLGTNWSTPPKPANNFYANWDNTTLGAIFGITLDNNTPPNAYVSSTQVYGGSNFNRKIWRLNGTTGANTLVFDFNNPSGIGTATSPKSLGNVKYYKFGAVENIYVSDFNTGEIHRLTGSSTTTTLWANQQAFIPKFGASSAVSTSIPYGLAIRKTSNISKLYYAKLNTTAMNSTFEIWSIDLNAVGDFISGTETQQFLPTVPNNPKTPIADIAFTEDGKKMLIGQQSWTSFTSSLGAHQSMVIELENVPINTNTWVTGNNFPSGGINNGTNCVGGVSYSSNILKTENQYDCDKSVYFTTDAIQLNSPAVYGVQGMYSTGGSLANSIWIDADDYYSQQDKNKLGDIEIYKNPNACIPPCSCGRWESIGLNDNANWWNQNTSPTPQTLPSLTQGNTTGILFPRYKCTPDNCTATYSYSLITNASSPGINLSGTTSLDLSQPAIKNLPCGSYTINITPRCGNVPCPPISIPLVIECPPPCSDCGGNASVTGTPTISNGTISGNFTINNAKPVSEVRVLVEEFRVTSTNENCLICKNPPKSWGSIQSATLGTISPAFSNAVTMDNREVVFKNNAVLPMPANMAINLALPESVKLNCCEVRVQVCLKFIIRDVNCCEKEILKCFTFTLPQ